MLEKKVKAEDLGVYGKPEKWFPKLVKGVYLRDRIGGAIVEHEKGTLKIKQPWPRSIRKMNIKFNSNKLSEEDYLLILPLLKKNYRAIWSGEDKKPVANLQVKKIGTIKHYSKCSGEYLGSYRTMTQDMEINLVPDKLEINISFGHLYTDRENTVSPGFAHRDDRKAYGDDPRKYAREITAVDYLNILDIELKPEDEIIVYPTLSGYLHSVKKL